MAKANPKSPEQRLLSRIATRKAVVGVIGLGYVGLPLAKAMHAAGFRVVGFDIDESKVKALKSGKAYLRHLGTEIFKTLAKSDRFTPTSNPSDLRACDAVAICVPTPLGKHDEPDLSYVVGSTEAVAKVLRPGALVTLESTTYPGTTREICKPILEKRGLVCGRDLFIAFSPEREDPGRAGLETKTIPRVVGGLDPASTRIATALYSAAVESVYTVSSAEVAESAKLLENIYRAVNIALVNELKPVLYDMGIDVWEVVKAASTKPFGFQAFYPGPGLGGHCIPIDPYYLTYKAREYGHVTRFIELAGMVNRRMPEYVVERLSEALNHDGLAVKGAKVLVLGVAYKPNVDDVRETPAAEVIQLLLKRGAKVSYHDPHVPAFPVMRKHRINLRSVPLTPATIGASDAVLIVTDHAATDYKLVGRHAGLVVDSRNAMASVRKPKARIVKA